MANTGKYYQRFFFFCSLKASAALFGKLGILSKFKNGINENLKHANSLSNQDLYT